MFKRPDEYKDAVAKLHDSMVKNIIDEILTTDKIDFSSHHRKAVIVIDEIEIERIIQEGLAIYVLFNEALRRVSVEIKQGYEPPFFSLEVFDHQAREWVVSKIEKLFEADHAWRQLLMADSNYKVLLAFGYGSLPARKNNGELSDEKALLPTAYAQLIHYDENPDGELIATEGWDLTTDGVYVDMETLKSFGRIDKGDANV